MVTPDLPDALHIAPARPLCWSSKMHSGNGHGFLCCTCTHIMTFDEEATDNCCWLFVLSG